MIDLRIRTDEACDPQPQLLWDTVWSTATMSADWAVSDGSEPLNPGGLQAKAAIATAVVLALFSDRRCPDDHPLAHYADSDKRGWWGDLVDLRPDLGEAPLGSLLWLLERAAVTERTAQWARAMIEEALAPLIAQKAAASMTIEVDVTAGRRLDFGVSLFAIDGSKSYDRRFEVLWKQVG